MDIQVKTRGNVPLAQGGVRVGYQIGDYYYDLATRRLVSSIAATHPPKEKVIYYWQLPATYSDGSCRKCGNYGVNGSFYMTRDEGNKYLLVCGRCGQKLRPSED